MLTGFPTNTIGLILVSLIAVVIATWVIFSQSIRRVPVPPARKRLWRWGVAIFLLLWFGSNLYFAAFPPQAGFLSKQANLIVTSIGIGMLFGLGAFLISPTFRQILQAIPSTNIVLVHALRLEGFFFLALLDMHLLPPGFALPAGLGDMTVGALALGVAYLLAKRTPHIQNLLIAWNLLGMLDFVSAMTTGLLLIGPFAAQAAASGASISYLNYVLLVPSFGIPLLALLHVYSLFQTLTGHVVENQSTIKQAI